MSRHKTPRINARNWDVLVQQDIGSMPVIEKVRSAPKLKSFPQESMHRDASHFHRSRGV